MNRARSWLYLGPALALTGALLFIAFAPKARAAEAARYPLARVVGWAVDLHWRDYEAAGKSHQRLSGYLETRAECEALKARMVARVKGGRLQCAFTDELMVVRP